jgi:hypothetical protein
MLIKQFAIIQTTQMTQKIVGILGFIGSGKNTVGNHLVNSHGFQSASFAESLKDAISAIFGWPRDMIEGSTSQSRIWREEPDIYWSKKMGRTVTPRWVLQHLGTNVLRDRFFDDIWIASLEHKIKQTSRNVVITDVRFPNEIKMIRENNGMLIWVKRGELPTWYNCALHTPDSMPGIYPTVHSSEYMWVSQGPFSCIDNNETITQLHQQVDALF